MPPIIYKTLEAKQQALRDNALRYYYKKKGLDFQQATERQKIKKFVKKYLNSDENYEKVYNLLQSS